MSSTSSECPIHLVLVGNTLAGHLNPLLQLAFFLVKPRATHSRCCVTLCLLTRDSRETDGLIPKHESIRVLMESGFDMGEWFQDMHGLNERYAEKMVARLPLPDSEWPKVDAVVFDFVSTVGAIMAEKMRVPSFVYLTSPMICLWSLIQINMLTTQKELKSFPKSYSIPGLGEIPLPPLNDEIARRMSTKMSHNCVTGFKKAKGCLVNDIQSMYSTHFLESRPPKALPQNWSIFCVGPLALQDPRLRLNAQVYTDRSVLDFLDRHSKRSVLYIALGSCCSLSPNDLIELVRGIAASNRPFLMIYRRDTGASFGSVSPPLTKPAKEETDADGLPKNFREEVQNRGMIVEWVNQPQILSHPSIGVFLTHCGWNSVMEAMAFGGMPYVLLPIRGDQAANAGLLQNHLKCGKLVRIPPEPVDRERVRQVVEDVFGDEEMISQAQRLHQIALQDSAEGGVCDTNITSFLTTVAQAAVANEDVIVGAE